MVRDMPEVQTSGAENATGEALRQPKAIRRSEVRRPLGTHWLNVADRWRLSEHHDSADPKRYRKLSFRLMVRRSE